MKMFIVCLFYYITAVFLACKIIAGVWGVPWQSTVLVIVLVETAIRTAWRESRW